MAALIPIPLDRVPADTLQAMLEEYASRDGTDYGERELSLEEKVTNLRGQLDSGALTVLYDLSSEQWDLVPTDRLEQFQE